MLAGVGHSMLPRANVRVNSVCRLTAALSRWQVHRIAPSLAPAMASHVTYAAREDTPVEEAVKREWSTARKLMEVRARGPALAPVPPPLLHPSRH